MCLITSFNKQHILGVLVFLEASSSLSHSWWISKHRCIDLVLTGSHIYTDSDLSASLETLEPSFSQQYITRWPTRTHVKLHVSAPA